MELRESPSGASSPSLLSELFALTSGHGHRNAADQARAVRLLHERLNSSEFVAQMTRVFFEAKRAALARTK